MPVYSTGPQFRQPVIRVRMRAARMYANVVYKVHMTLILREL